MNILIATSTVTFNAGIPSFNRELSSLLGKDNTLDLLVDENISIYTGYRKVYTTAAFNLNSLKSSRKLVELINDNGYDLIINSNSHALAIIAPFINDDTKILTVSHSLGTLDCDNAAFNHRYIDGIIALSNNCKEYILSRFKRLSSDKVSVVYNSVATLDNSQELNTSKRSNNTLSIVFAGGTAPSKSPDIAIKVLRELCKTNLRFKFYWLGNSTPPLKKFQPYSDIREILPHDDRIVITGRIPQSEASKIIASCNIFLAPSRREGFPMALLEAMRVGCIPIISDYNIANKEVIKNEDTGFIISHNDISGFVSLIKDIIVNHDRYIDIYQNTYRDFIDNLSFSVWYRNIDNVVRGIKNKHKQRKRFTNTSFLSSLYRFKLLDKYNLVENHIKEVIPCAYIFWKIYKSNKQCQ